MELASQRRDGPERLGRQLQLFPRQAAEAWRQLSTNALRLDERKYQTIRDCYEAVFESFLPGPGVVSFYRQVAERLNALDIETSPKQIADLVRRARALGIDDFRDVTTRKVTPASASAAKLRLPGAPVRMSLDEHNAFAKIYRELLRTGVPKKNQGAGFYEEAAARMQSEGFPKDAGVLQQYASYRRRIGDVNFPRLRGSHDLERMHIAAVDRIQTLGVMASGLMHEILQPLQIILLDAELQKEDVENNRYEPQKLIERMEEITREVRKLSHVVQHVRTMARAGELTLGPVSLRDSVDNVLHLFLAQLRGRGIEVDVSGLPADLPAVSADAVALERIFINLITNARDAIDETNRGDGSIGISAYAAGESLVIAEVSDNGVGISEETLPRIFDPYFTTKELGKGTGLGLTEVMNLMIQFGGRVTVTSVPRQHTTFRMEFPRHVEPT